MVINTNIQAQINADNLSASTARLSKSLARLSSGSKIVNPADDAAGLAVAARLDAQVQRLVAAKNNVSNAISFTQTQDGYLKKIAKALDRMSELAILAQDVTKTDADRALYNNEFQQLNSYMQEAANKDFNGVPLFSTTGLDVTTDSEGNSFTMDGIPLSSLKSMNPVGPSTLLADLGTSTPITEGTLDVNGTVIAISTTDTLQDVFDKLHAADARITGSFDSATGKINLEIAHGGGTNIVLDATTTNFLSATGLVSGALPVTYSADTTLTSSETFTTAPKISTIADAKAALSAIKLGISGLAEERATIGSYQARLNYTAEQLTISRENLTAASSRIQDVDVAEEATEFAKQNILVQSGTAMLAQANQMPQSVLRLLQ